MIKRLIFGCITFFKGEILAWIILLIITGFIMIFAGIR